MPEKKKETVEKKSTLEEYLANDRINQKLYDTIKAIPRKEKQDHVIDTLHRRLKNRDKLAL